MSDYSSTAEVKTFTKHLLNGMPNFNDSTNPTSDEVTTFLSYADAALNTALKVFGFATPITDTTADSKTLCDRWATIQVAALCELVQGGRGFSDDQGERFDFADLDKNALEFVEQYMAAFERDGVTRSYSSSDSFNFTGIDAPSERDDPDDSSLAQPKFKRGLGDHPEGSGFIGASDSEASS